jgi:phosphoglycerol geranylgeranyltransferase
MDSNIYHSLFSGERKVFALLIDPEKQTKEILEKTIEKASLSRIDVILVGGSLTSRPVDDLITAIKSMTSIPVVLFPGNLLQISPKADGILLLSLISGRNPEYLIGNHVLVSQFLKKSQLEIISTGYILVDGASLSSVEYISNTRPIPSDKDEIVVATALAGEQLGHKLIYLEAGSGSNCHVKEETVEKVKDSITIPLIVGGGIRSAEHIRMLYKAGADGVVVGSAIEENYMILPELASVRHEFQ